MVIDSGDRFDRQPAQELLGDRGRIVVLVKVEAVCSAAVSVTARIDDRSAVTKLVQVRCERHHRRVATVAPETGDHQNQRTGRVIVEVVGDRSGVERGDHSGYGGPVRRGQ
jgi:hypothetical protein